MGNTQLKALLVWNLGAMTLCLGLAGMVSSLNLPGRISTAEVRGLMAGDTGGYELAVNASSNKENPCYYCVNIPKPSSGSLGCFDAGQVLKKGIYKYSSIPSLCRPETRFAKAGCTGKATQTGADCTTNKPIYKDP